MTETESQRQDIKGKRKKGLTMLEEEIMWSLAEPQQKMRTTK